MNWRILRWSGGLTLAASIASSGVARADKHGKHDRDDDDDQGRHYYSDHDRDYMTGWYHDHDRKSPAAGTCKAGSASAMTGASATSAGNASTWIAQEENDALPRGN